MMLFGNSMHHANQILQCVIAKLIKLESHKCTTGCKRQLSTTCVVLAAWGCTFTYQPLLWIQGTTVTASTVPVAGAQAVNGPFGRDGCAQRGTGAAPPPRSTVTAPAAPSTFPCGLRGLE